MYKFDCVCVCVKIEVRAKMQVLHTLDIISRFSRVLSVCLVLPYIQMEANYAHSSYYQGLLEYEPEALKVLLMSEVRVCGCLYVSLCAAVAFSSHFFFFSCAAVWLPTLPSNIIALSSMS